MPTLNDVPIAEAKPSDRPHILVWNHFTDEDLEDLRFRHGTYRVNYRKDLLDRHQTTSSSSFLALNRRIDREIQALRDLCEHSPLAYVQLEDLDRLITYLASTNSQDLELFWQKLIDLRQLPKILWIILPSSLVPSHWPSDRLQYVDTPVR